MLAGGWMAHLEFARDKQAADPVLHQIAIDLGWEVLPRVFQPDENAQAIFVGQRVENPVGCHSRSINQNGACIFS